MSAALLVLATAIGVTAASASPLKSAQPTSGIGQVGPLFPGSTIGPHTCTAVVIHSRHGNLALTAAHCVSGKGTGLKFAPGYHDGKTPHGVWDVVGAYAAPAWISHQNPLDDFAILRLRRDPRDSSGARLPAGLPIGYAPDAGWHVTVYAYNFGVGGMPVGCTAKVYYRGRYPAFDCDGYKNGSSGSPFLNSGRHNTYVRGVIGGLHQGGCSTSTSYSAPFGETLFHLLHLANSGARTQTLPAPGSDGC